MTQRTRCLEWDLLIKGGEGSNTNGLPFSVAINLRCFRHHANSTNSFVFARTRHHESMNPSKLCFQSHRGVRFCNPKLTTLLISSPLWETKREIFATQRQGGVYNNSEQTNYSYLPPSEYAADRPPLPSWI